MDKGCAFLSVVYAHVGNARSLWIRLYGHGLRFRSSWYGASDGAVPGVGLPVFLSRESTSKQLGRAGFLGPCPQGHGHN